LSESEQSEIRRFSNSSFSVVVCAEWYVLQLNYASIVIYILKANNCGLLRYINWNLGSSKLLPLVIFSLIILAICTIVSPRASTP